VYTLLPHQLLCAVGAAIIIYHYIIGNAAEALQCGGNDACFIAANDNDGKTGHGCKDYIFLQGCQVLHGIRSYCIADKHTFVIIQHRYVSCGPNY
jgi:hypothetical protein